MTTKQTSTKPATKAAKAAKRSAAPKRSAVETEAASVLARLASDEITTAEAMAEAQRIGDAITKRTVHDSVAMLAIIGTVAVAEYEAKHGAPKPKASLPSLSTVADYFVTTTVGKASGYEAATVRQAVTIARIADRYTVLSLWDRFADDDAAKASDPDAYKRTVIAFVRFATAWKADRVNPDTGVIFATKDAAKVGDDTKVASVVNAASSDAAKAKAKATKRAKVRKAKAEAAASEDRIGAIRVADVAALTKPQRAKLAELLASLES